jgi:hypothetical protein
LGQEKLQIERQKSILSELGAEDRRTHELMIEAMQSWVENQHYLFLQYVDIGSWSGISTRKMAEEAECLNIYDFAFTPWSYSVHSTWNHIGKADSFPSAEPLHKHIRQPANLRHGQHFDVVWQAAKYFDETCSLLVNEFNLEMELPPPRTWVSERLETLIAEMNEEGDEESS